MTKKPDGGPAYPTLGNIAHNPDWMTEDGMTLRQSYAKAAMQGIYSCPDVVDGLTPGGSGKAMKQIAEHAFAQADAMIAAEEEEPDDAR